MAPAVSVWVGRVHEADVDAHLGQGDGEEVEGPAVEAGGGHQLIAGPQDVQDSQGLGRLAGGRGQGTHTALQQRDPLLEDVGGGVHDAGIDVAGLLQGEQARPRDPHR